MAIDKTDWVLGKALAAQARQRPDRPFVQFMHGAPLTYGQADAAASRLAQGLRRAGVQPGQRVAVMLPNGLEIILAWLGLARCGAVCVFVNTAYRGAYLEHVLNNAQAERIILHPDSLPWLAESEDRLPLLKQAYLVDGALSASGRPAAPGGPLPLSARLQRVQTLPFAALLEAPAEPPTMPLDREPRYTDLANIMYTSGTTGPSKGVLMPFAHLHLWGIAQQEHLRMTPEDVYYICMPLFHANALLMQLYGTLIAGARAVVVPGFSASRWLDDVRSTGATLTNTLGVMTEFIYRQPPRPEDRDHRLRCIVAVPLPAEIKASFAERFNVLLIEGYGMTEINIPVMMNLDTPYRPGSAGQVWHRFFEARIVDPDTDEEQPAGAVGEIVVRPKEPYCFMQGYNAMPDRTAEAWRNLWFHTGDAGRRDADGYFYFVDRIKDTIRHRGENLSSYEIERVIAEHPAVAEVAALAVKSSIAGGEDEVKVCIVLKPEAKDSTAPAGGAQLEPSALLDFCQGRMPHFAVPRYVEFVDALPKTPTQKVQKAVLRQDGLNARTWDRAAAGYKVRR